MDVCCAMHESLANSVGRLYSTPKAAGLLCLTSPLPCLVTVVMVCSRQMLRLSAAKLRAEDVSITVLQSSTSWHEFAATSPALRRNGKKQVLFN